MWFAMVEGIQCMFRTPLSISPNFWLMLTNKVILTSLLPIKIPLMHTSRNHNYTFLILTKQTMTEKNTFKQNDFYSSYAWWLSFKWWLLHGSSFAEDWYSVEVTSRSCVGVNSQRGYFWRHISWCFRCIWHWYRGIKAKGDFFSQSLTETLCES